MSYEIKKGDKFLCIKDFVMKDGEVAFTKGRHYVSEYDNRLTDDQGHPNHWMNNVDDFYSHFTLSNVSEKGSGLRFNNNKTRHDLVPAYAQEHYARVLTAGAEKYCASSNWENISYICSCEKQPAIPIELIILKDYVEAVTRNSLGIQTLSLLIDKEITVEIGGETISKRKKRWTNYTEREIANALRLAKQIGLLRKEGSLLNQLENYLSSKDTSVLFAEGSQAREMEYSTLIMTTKQVLGEDFCAEPVTWESACSEIANNYLKMHSNTCRILQQKYSWDSKRNRFYIPNSGSRNWEKGMKWSIVLASLKRHILAFERGEDFDPETGQYHMAHVMCNAAFLTEYYKIFPQGDDRPHTYLSAPKIGLDIDEVLADWVGHWTKYHGQAVPETWNFDRNIGEKFDKLKDDKEFWLSIPVKTKPEDIHFEPHCYITSRNIPVEWTMEWLDKNGFPTMPVYSIGHGESKVDVARKSGIDIFVDDRFENFVELNSNGVCCYLFTATHNERYDVGHKRINSLKDLCK